jgi:RecJ-like exonuclease
MCTANTPLNINNINRVDTERVRVRQHPHSRRCPNEDDMTASFPCYKCNGSGLVAFRHIANGVCFTCAGSGKLSYQPKAKAFVEPHPEWVVPEANRATQKQWDYLVKLTGDSDDIMRRLIRQAGAPSSCGVYVTKAQMSAAIERAKQGHTGLEAQAIAA